MHCCDCCYSYNKRNLWIELIAVAFIFNWWISVNPVRFRAPHHTTSFSKFIVRWSWLCKYCSYFYRILPADLFLQTLKCCCWFLITCVGTLRMSCRYKCLKFLLLILFIFLASGLDTSTPSQSSLSDEASLFINQQLEITLAH